MPSVVLGHRLMVTMLRVLVSHANTSGPLLLVMMNRLVVQTDVPMSLGALMAKHIPSFVGQNYFCETGITRYDGSGNVFWPNGDPLWDGQGCGPTSSCCTFNSPPWFNVTLPSGTTDYVEVQLCGSGIQYEDAPIQLMELYVK